PCLASATAPPHARARLATSTVEIVIGSHPFARFRSCCTERTSGLSHPEHVRADATYREPEGSSAALSAATSCSRNHTCAGSLSWLSCHQSFRSTGTLPNGGSTTSRPLTGPSRSARTRGTTATRSV